MSVPGNPSESSPSPVPSSRFCTTHWSLVAAATHRDDPASAAALESLCRTYWYPLYAFVRRQGRTAHDAQDLTQEFFARLLEKHYLEAASAEKGRFRTFLLVALKRFLAKEWDRSHALKRGGGRIHIPLDGQWAESRYLAEPTDALDPERIFERRWAATLLEQSLHRLRGEFERSGRGNEFEQLKEFLAAERGSIPYDKIATALGISTGAARVQLHRMRKRFRDLFRDQIAETVSNSDELDEEVRYVLTVLSQG
ncbi:MAG TPA: sigma-70 family RNA polymerase sigma factor [Pirellulales bacterium]|jgi:RNA polymerase sigma-70 factor (ECF subfamily)